MGDERGEVAIVGGGLAGATLAIHLARAGREVIVLERSLRPHRRACGVFSPTALPHVEALGLPPGELHHLAREIPALQLVTPSGVSFALTYGAGAAGGCAAGFARPELDAALLALAQRAGARVRRGAVVTGVTPAARRGASAEISIRDADGLATTVRAALVVGADGIRSLVARETGTVRRPIVGPRLGLSYHVAEAVSGGALERGMGVAAVMAVFPGGYCALAPVPGRRLNVGIVLDPRQWSQRLRQEGARAVVQSVVASVGPVTARARIPAGAATRRPVTAPTAAPLDAVGGAFPLAHAVARVAGPGWLLVGDAAGFLDPFTGEGIGRAFVTARLAAEAVEASLGGDRAALERYDREIRARYRARDRLTWLVEQFLAQPALFEYAARRLATRPRLRGTLDGVLAERLPAGDALDPRFLAALLRP